MQSKQLKMQTEAIVPTDTLKAKRADLYKVPSSKIIAKEEDNVRTVYNGITELSESIKENGVKMPLKGRKVRINGEDYFEVTDGFRRSRAIKMLLEQGIEILVPFVLEPQGYSSEERLFDMFLMNEGDPLTPLDKAAGIKKALAWGYTEKQIAQKLAKSEGYIRKLNSLNSAPIQLKNLIETGVISATLAIDAIANNKVEEILKKAESNSTTVVPEDTTTQDTQSNDGQQITTPSAGKITKKDLVDQNSMKEFKKFMKSTDEESVPEGVLYVYQFAAKLANNELSFEEIKEFFS